MSRGLKKKFHGTPAEFSRKVREAPALGRNEDTAESTSLLLKCSISENECRLNRKSRNKNWLGLLNAKRDHLERPSHISGKSDCTVRTRPMLSKMFDCYLRHPSEGKAFEENKATTKSLCIFGRHTALI